jgi:hypothetical protein
VPVLFSSLAAALGAGEDMMKRGVLVVATWRKWSGKWSNNGLYNYWADFTDWEGSVDTEDSTIN